MRNSFFLLLISIQISRALLTETDVCQTNSYFDTPNYNCETCGNNAVQNTTSGQAC